MKLLISDANILIDMEAGALMETLFRLPMEFGIPDLEQLGLRIMEVRGEFVKYAEDLPGQYNHTLPAKHGAKPTHNDYLALALAKQESCTLPTGDANLKTVASLEHVPVMGSIGLLCVMVENRILTVEEALTALERMKEGKRRLPWAEAERILGALR